MPGRDIHILKRPEHFVVPKVYTAPGEPGYRPSYDGVQPVDCNLVLEGGAMRGVFTAGVLDFLMDNALLPQFVIGVSAGALNGFNYRAGLRGRTCYLNTKYCTDWRYLSMQSFTRTGNAFNVEFVFDEIPNKLDPFDYDAYARSPLRLVTVSSDLERGAADYCVLEDARAQLDYLRASAAIPLLSKPVEVDGKVLLDGGICDSVPLEYSLATGAKKQLLVLTQHDGYVKGPNRAMPVARRLYARYPAFIERMESRHVEYNRVYERVKELERKGEIFVLRPPEPVTVASMEHDPKKLYELWQVGYEEARKRFADLRNYLSL
jgi:predicted patatin/cPLA2 family phospholipase